MNKNEENLLFQLLVDTLTMIALEKEHFTDSMIEENLIELEGDYFTFLHFDNLKKMQNANKLNENQVKNIQKIRNLIESIDPSLWNVHSFKQDKRWKEVSLLAAETLKSLGIKA